MVNEVVRPASLSDVSYIVSLANKESKSLGFIPKMAYESAITGVKTGKRWSNVCNDKLFVCEINDDLVGFVLSSFGNPFSNNRQGKIAQICLQNDARKMARGKLLLNAVIEWGKMIGTTAFNCGCADDLESNLFWICMGWTKIGTRNGISHTNTWRETSARKINLYRYDPHDLFLS